MPPLDEPRARRLRRGHREGDPYLTDELYVNGDENHVPTEPEEQQHFFHGLMDAELCAAELMARNSHEHPEMPWDFHVDMARQSWDEIRHAEVHDLLMATELGCHWGDYPVGFALLQVDLRLRPARPARAVQRHERAEGDVAPLAPAQGADRARPGDGRAVFDYLLADEVPHVHNGVRWGIVPARRRRAGLPREGARAARRARRDRRPRLRTAGLGSTGLEITRIGFGAWAIGGGDWEFGWGAQEDEESIAAIHRALEQGVNWIDTAAAYGFGHSEEVVGRALEGVADRPHVFTKCSLLEGPDRTVVHSLERDSVMREAEASLKRLRVDAIDLYQIHWPDPDADIEEGWSALAELKEQGMVRHIGVSNFDVEQLAPRPADRPGRDAAAAVLADRARGRGRAPAVRRARGHRRDRLLPDGLRAADRADDARAHRGHARQRLAKARPELPGAGALDATWSWWSGFGPRPTSTTTTPGAVAVAWTLQNPAVDGAIVGFRRADQVDAILAGADLELEAL